MDTAIFQFIFIMMIIFTAMQIATYRKAEKQNRKWAVFFGTCYALLAVFSGYLIFT